MQSDVSGYNIALEQNKESTLLEILNTNNPITNRHTDGNFLNEFNNFKAITKFESDSSVPSLPSGGQKYSFDLGTSGFLEKVVIKTDISATGDNSGLQERLGTYLFSTIRTLQKNRELAGSNNSHILCRIADLESTEQTNMNTLTNGTAVLNNNTVTFYTPCYFYYSDNLQSSLCLDFYSDLRLELELNTIAFVGLTEIKVEIITYKTYYEQEYMNRYISSLEITKTFLANNIIKKSKVPDNGSSRTAVIIDGPFLASALHVSVRTSSGASVQISRLVLNKDTRDIIDVDRNALILDAPKKSLSASGTELSYYFGDRDRNLIGHTGSINLSNGPNIVYVYHSDPGSGGIVDINIEYLTTIKATDKGAFVGSYLN